MKKIMRIALVGLLATASMLWSATSANARTQVDWSVNIGVPGPAYYPPPPVYYAPPPPVYYAPPPPPRPVYVQPPPVYVEAYPQPYYRYPDYHRRGHGWREREWRERDWRMRHDR
ncbi:hypothetical protein [Glaciimonas sp. PCH181]|uniref:hypothetical protein n=1 Tax=Glaciimonas sp. PCH181 TaxID=2133943 RepID=UPI000D3CE0D8|nr:hypothetical protein [Glaciimonas sp. PCH181]PUA16963.1 hypothetical protein C7W93_13395 [Glaciimonas sp. PCH181]